MPFRIDVTTWSNVSITKISALSIPPLVISNLGPPFPGGNQHLYNRDTLCSNMTKDDKGKSPKSKKTKEPKAKEVEVEVEAVPYAVRMKAVTVISKPMADEKKVCVCVQVPPSMILSGVGFVASPFPPFPSCAKLSQHQVVDEYKAAMIVLAAVAPRMYVYLYVRMYDREAIALFLSFVF